MKSKTIVWLIAVSALFVGVFQTIALKYYLYWTIWWFDIMMHFLGGFWVGLIILWFYKVFMDTKARSDHAYMLALLGVILVGVSWEIMEILGGLVAGENNYAFDTILDLIMDTIGAIAATYLVFKKKPEVVIEKNNV